MLAVVVFAGTVVLSAPPAQAFKPYTHSSTGDDARADATDDGNVTINGHDYPVNPAVVAALQNWPTYYNAGVIGPDGFPDLTMGQSVIHPEDTGRWLKYILDRAWAAQTDPSYTDDEKGQILAFAYGFLTHAAGDLWAHTLINELSGGVFPAVGDVLTDANAASIAVRHIVAEGYVGDATPGYDGNSDRTLLPDGDVSDDSTPEIHFDAPIRFIYETLVKQNADAPSTERGPLIGFFTDLRSSLAAFVTDNPDPIADALSAFNDTKSALTAAQDDCNFESIPDAIHDVVACPIALVGLAGAALVDSAEAFANFVTSSLELAVKVVLNAYANAWIADIDDGLQHWGEIGLASARAFFDPQARRNTQNDECGPVGSEDQLVRANCEDGIGFIDTLMHESDDFINNHLLSMLGAPDFVGDLRAFLEDVSDLIDDIVGPLLNPVRETLAQIKDFAADLLKDAINDRFGIDIDEISDFITSPTNKLDLTTINLGVFGTINFFAADAHAKLDSYLHLAAGHHDGPGGGLGEEEFDPTLFAAYRNTVTTAKLLLLDGPVLDQALSDLTGHTYHLYGNTPHGNIMTTTLPGAGSDPTEWLKLIDGDHAWRADGLPVFGPGAPEHPIAGNGNMPIWESCILRPAFRALFVDWENGAQNFPDLGDGVSTDPSDPNAPVSTLTVGTPKFVSGSTTYVGGATLLTLGATDDFWSPTEISVDVRIRAGAAVGGSFTTMSSGSNLSLSGQPDGVIHIDLVAHDPCRTETMHTVDVVLDTTPPTVTYTQPALAQYATDQFASIQFSVSDLGSGVASSSVTFDGAAATNGQALDMFFLTAGLHTIVVTATDNVGNTGTTPRVFRVRATSASLLSNLDRARSLGLIPNAQVYTGLRDSLVAANASHRRGQHPTEWNQLQAFVNQILGQLGKGIDRATGLRFIGYALDLIASGG